MPRRHTAVKGGYYSPCMSRHRALNVFYGVVMLSGPGMGRGARYAKHHEVDRQNRRGVRTHDTSRTSMNSSSPSMPLQISAYLPGSCRQRASQAVRPLNFSRSWPKALDLVLRTSDGERPRERWGTSQTRLHKRGDDDNDDDDDNGCQLNGPVRARVGRGQSTAASSRPPGPWPRPLSPRGVMMMIMMMMMFLIMMIVVMMMMILIIIITM
jgi:hypothetical protein